MMFGVLLWKEIRDHLKTFRFGAALLTTFVLILLSVWVLGNDYLNRLNTYNTLSEEYARQAEGILVPSMAEPRISFPPSPLSIFAQGEMSRFGNFVTIKRWEVPREATESLSNNDILESIPTFDLLTIFLFVISLFGVLISYDSIAGEKERGTLRQLCVGRITRGGIYAAKFLGMNAVLAIPFLVSYICALIVLQFLLNISFSPFQWMSIGLMVVCGLLYGAVFIAVGMLSSALCKRSSTAIVIALLIWAAAVFFLPIAGSRFVEATVEPPSSFEITSFEVATEEELTAECTNFARSNWPDDFENLIFSSMDYRRGGPDGVVFDGSPAAYSFISEIIRTYEPRWQRRAEEVWNLVYEQNARKSEQAGLAATLSSVSPAYHLRTAFTSLAGTGYAQYADFLEQARAYRRQFLRNMALKGYWGENAHLFYSRRPRAQIESLAEYEARQLEYLRLDQTNPEWSNNAGSSTELWETIAPLPGDLIPPFNYHRGESDLISLVGPLGALLGFVLAALFAGVVVFSRYDVR